MDTATAITILGNGAVRPSVGGESASFLINDHILVDAGWCNVLHMRRFGIDPANIDHLVITHFHHDHYMGLPQLLYYLGSGRRLTILGPAQDLERNVDRALAFLDAGRFPNIAPSLSLVPLRPGDRFDGEGFSLECIEAIHPVPALSYRFTDHVAEARFAFTGDTGPNPNLVPFAAGCSLLMHEASYGGNPAPKENPQGHSGAPDAARIANLARTPRLLLLHCPEEKVGEALKAAQSLHPDVIYPREGERIVVFGEPRNNA